MKRMLALALAALVLLFVPMLPVRAEESEGAEEPAATKAPAEPKPTEKPEAKPTEAAKATPEPAEKEEPKQTPKTPEKDKATAKPKKTPGDRPQPEKSLAAWEEERAEIQLSGDLRDDVLTIARSQLGYSADKTYYEKTKSGRKKYYTRYGDWYGPKFCDWCDAFVSFCVYYAGNESYPLEYSCGRHEFKLKQAGYWREWNSYVPKKGDLVFFAFTKDRWVPDHVAIVEEVHQPEGDKPGYLVTIEGNQKNPEGGAPCVRRMERKLDQVVGYGVYDKGAVYPEAYTVRSNGRQVIDEGSQYFIERPTKAAMRFLGMEGTKYYAYWFPAAAEEEPEAAPGPELTVDQAE